ncbi:MAG: hypothetical protein ACPHCL_08080, partial [Candidatus Puniceispirillaceae bacterium]
NQDVSSLSPSFSKQGELCGTFNKHAACQGIIASILQVGMMQPDVKKRSPEMRARNLGTVKNKELKNKKAPILRALFLFHIFKQAGAVPINGVSGYFTPRPPKRLLKRAT